MATIMFGDFPVQLKHTTKTEKRKRVVETTRLEYETRMETVHVHVMESITIGCTARCAGLGAYTKSSLRRAIKEGDLSASGGCNYCGLRALVGEGRERVISVPKIVAQQKEVVVTKEVPHFYEEEYEVEVPCIAHEIVQSAASIAFTSDVCGSAVQTKVTNSVVTKDMMAKSEPSLKKISRAVVLASKKEIDSYDLAIKKMDEAMQQNSALQRRLLIQRQSPVKQTQKGAVQLRHVQYEVAVERERMTEKRRLEEEKFLAGDYSNDTYIGSVPYIRGAQKTGETVSFRSPHYRRTAKAPNRVKKGKQYCNQQHVLSSLLRICSKTGVTIEIVGKKRTNSLKVRYVKKYGCTLPQARLPHHDGVYKHTEVQMAPYERFLTAMCDISKYRAVEASSIQRGDSGLVFDRTVAITREHTKLPFFIVRGRSNGKLINALEKYHQYHSIEHYSHQPEMQFFHGWKQMFDKMAPQMSDHDCTVDYNNEHCGELAAQVCQSLFPVRKLSCQKCRQNLIDLTFEEYKQFLLTHLGCTDGIWKVANASKDLTMARALLYQATSSNNSIDTTMEIARLTQNCTSTAMLQIRDINVALMKGQSVTQDELTQASKQLLEMTRWWRNHMALTGEEALKTFRNRRSSKAMINPSLLCDNQLDKNGNFVWGERGRHSKRFFSNFFDEVIPSEGYKKFVIRTHPNGSRKLAIDSLIVPLDLARARIALQGESIQRVPFTLACTSSQDSNFVYPCCCVTQDDGKPLYSDLKSPTKRHLVVGTSGDPKYIDLPVAETDRMYIAKEGYCYLNIFLAMLVNVNEDDAKDFTKMVRDVIVPKLGTWPTMTDLATAVYMLTVFHPETRNAELPRILVDHATQTMHVIDSFGSLTVGYHVLKAGTANQLIQFASNDLKSEMKHYRVGGTVDQRMKCEAALIKSIFKPKMMRQILETDPYLLIMGLVSPSILLHMYRLKYYDEGVKLWIHKDQGVARIMLVMEKLTRKVAVNTVLLEQKRMIRDTAKQLYSILNEGTRTMHSFAPAQELLNLYMETADTNEELTRTGYYDINESLDIDYEKMYVRQLEREWRALSLLEKSCLTWQLKRFSMHTEERLIEAVSKERKGYSGTFVSVCFTTAQTHLKDVQHSVSVQITNITAYIQRKFLSLLFRFVNRCYGDIIYLVNVSIIFSLLIQTAHNLRSMIQGIKDNKVKLAMIEDEHNELTVMRMYNMCAQINDGTPTAQSFLNHVKQVRPDLVPIAESYVMQEEKVATQSKTVNQLQLEKIIALMALITMCIDHDRSDAVFRILHKIKTVFGTIGEEVRVQSLDDIMEIEDSKQLTIDFDISTSQPTSSVSFDVQFEDWWNRQMQQNRVVPHYRTTGEFIEFTRETAAKVANQISTSSAVEFLIRGAVGSGKSTGLPHHLSKKGKVLLLEPTRPLAENVSNQLAKDPFYHTVTLRMRGLSKFGPSNIVVMTSGFAFHYFVNNPHQLNDYDYIIIDECHVMDSATIAFNCTLKEYEYAGKLLKVSATPPGRECEFTTQHPVKLKIEEQLSFQNFSHAQGTGSNADMVQHGHNILVYVASYNEVDQLSKLLIEKQFQVTKVDGRTMQMGRVGIETKGCEGKPHFIVATNIIENGVTLDVDCVVDFGMKVVATLDTDCRCVRYDKKSVNYGERIQRLGRVGRHKPGFALRIGHTEKGIEGIPEFIATEAAFLSFAYGLPVTTQSVTTSLLGKCTVKQAKSALNFELTPFFTTNLIKYDGSIHPEVHKLLKPYKLRESEMILCKLAIPHQYTNQWILAKHYERMGIRVGCSETTKLPFYTHDVPDQLYEQMWKVVCNYKHDAGFGKLSSVSAAKISYTLSTDPTALPKTIAILDHLISEEMTKKNHFDTISSALTGHSFSLAGITESIRKRYLRDYTQQNITILQNARAQLMEFNSRNLDVDRLHEFGEIGVLNAVRLQSKGEICRFLGVKGRWDNKRIFNDVVIAGFALIGGGWMLWEYFKQSMKEDVTTQGRKRMIQKLKFRDAFDRKVGREVYADDHTMEHTFGEAYTKKGKQKGSTKTKGMGRKTRNFTHMYGVEPENYTTLRFVDPLTGHIMDESPRVDIQLVQDEIGEVRKQMVEDDLLDRRLIQSKPGIQAYFLGKGTEEALKVDLTPHRPTLLCMNSNAIAGFPEREDELRQTGLPQKVSMKDVPKPSDVVQTESKSVYKGLRDYNGISTLLCQLHNVSDGHKESVYGIGYGAYIITNGHLFKRNNGTLTIRTWQGEFTIANTTQLQIHVLEKKDSVIIRMPKDFPPFARKSLFRHPKKEERACIVGTNFQDKSMRATVSESSILIPEGQGSFWIHWITTQDGDCGLPLVSVSDGHIVGIHGLASNSTEKNFFVPFTNDFQAKYLDVAESLDWSRHWRWQPEKISWGSLRLVDEQPKDEFKISKLISDLFDTEVTTQSKRKRWVLESMEGNLRAIGTADSALVTKHVVKGKCPYFAQYLSENEKAKEFFTPLMGEYQPSRLNQEAFKKDFFKYNKAVVLNEVDCASFEKAVDEVKLMMLEFDFHETVFVTDPDEIFGSLNMKAAVGAQYKGKKQEYFDSMDEFDKERLLYKSCERLFYGCKGLWNGSLKAELRPTEKVLANKTRTFTAAPIDTLLGAKVCVDDFNNQFYSMNLRCPWTVGMTKFYGGWNKLMKALPDGWVYCHADGSQFDSSLTPLLLNAVLDIRSFFSEDWWVGQEMLENLYAEIVYTPILTPDGTIFKKFRGNNSGQPSTVVDNTLMVVISMYYACIKQGWSTEDIQERLVFFANGDDVILATEEKDEWLLNTLTKSFSELGLTYDFSERTRDRSELWFMSHRAILIDGMYIPKLEPERIVSILEWDRSKELMHRTEAICAAMIEAWGYTDLLTEIRKFYLWLLNRGEFKDLAKSGKAPYIAETALRKLYTDSDATMDEIQEYVRHLHQHHDDEQIEYVSLQSGKVEDESLNAGDAQKKTKNTEAAGAKSSNDKENKGKEQEQDRDVGAGSKGKLVPRLQKITKKMNLPMVAGRIVLDLDHLIEYKPSQTDLFNTRATKAQFTMWYESIKKEYELEDQQMGVVLNGFMVWCIDNGTSPDVNGVWVMMDGDEQVEYPLKPMVENAKPTLRQIMHHFSDAAEAYIEMRNSEGYYMPRYGLLRNLRDKSLARYAFDFYEVNSKTSDRAREAVAQMKAAALANVNTRLFGLDGNVATTSENTERHTAKDVNQNMHTLLGMGSGQ
ncbi:polyprotein [East Asian Passiflora distortion virus]|uniref:Genome polyprotein n=1 Tax=East Asian Passiflora distortion virus TaxID=2734556 RepID=A0A2Z6DRA9_9POTV|nr:polyprotein [East Asian Passiflora distortion virus]BBD74024.1 polyprotein [East Asian Passiflora distortion virus]